MNRNRFSLLYLPLFGLLFLAACQAAASPETVTPAPPTVNAEPPTPSATPDLQPQILFIGDSFTAGISEYVEQLAASVDPPVIMEGQEITEGGMSLWGHWLSPRPVATIQDGGWTAVVLQEDIALDGYDEERFFEYTRSFDQEIKTIGAETILYMHWEYDNDNPMRIEQIASAYGDIGAELGVKVAPVGLAWSRSIAERPDLDPWGEDRVHAGVVGNYLNTAVLYATIFGQSPEGLPLLPPDLTDEDIAFLQRIAWETVVDYQEENR